MDPEEILNLFDSCWFNLEIFKNQPSFSSISSKFMKKTDESADQPKFSSLRSIILRSKSDELSSMSSFNYGSSNSESPNSVLFNFSQQQLQTILSGKESKVEPEKEELLQQQQQQQQQQEQESELKKSPLSEKDKEKPKKVRRRRTKIKGVTKSLSDLEFEELKGFMDLGFVFSEKDKDSSLVEIIPGLQRLGGVDEKSDGSPNSKDQQEISSPVTKSESKSKSKSASRRPYLSEAWENLDKRKNLILNPNPLLMNWRVPSLSNEVDVKDSLKLWAHNVASVVR